MNLKSPLARTSMLAIAAFLSCKDDEPKVLTLSHEEVAVMVSHAISESTSGFTIVLNNAIAKTGEVIAAHENTAECGFTENHSIVSENKPGADHTFNYTHHYSYALSCGGEDPKNMDTAVTFQGEFDTPRMLSQHTGTVNIAISELHDDADDYHITGEYMNDGLYESRINETKTGENIVSFSSTDIKVSKATGEILSGTAQASITGTYPDKRKFAGEAGVTFHSNGTVTINVRGMDFLLHNETGALNSLD